MKLLVVLLVAMFVVLGAVMQAEAAPKSQSPLRGQLYHAHDGVEVVL